MTDGKIEVSVGNLKFSAEGQQDWLGEQLDKILKAAPTLVEPEPVNDAENKKTKPGAKSSSVPGTLPSYLKAKASEENQTKRFLATADWLRQKGDKLNTRSVTKALKENHQRKLTNPAHCLNQNVSKGFCEKTSDGFFITPDGLKSLGHSND